MSMEKNSIHQVKGEQNLFTQYIQDSENELNKKMNPKELRVSKQNLLENYLKQLLKAKYKQITPITKTIDNTENRFDLIKEKLLEVFEIDLPKRNGMKPTINSNISKGLLTPLENKSRKKYPLNCNRNKFRGSDKNITSGEELINFNNILRKFQNLKNITVLERINDLINLERNNRTVDNNRVSIDSTKSFSFLPDMRCSNINYTIFYNQNKRGKTHVKIDNQALPLHFDEQKLIRKPTGFIKIQEASIEQNGADKKKVQYASRTRGKKEAKHQKLKLKNKMQKTIKQKHFQEKRKEKCGIDWCYICKKIKACFCDNKDSENFEDPTYKSYKDSELYEVIT